MATLECLKVESDKIRSIAKDSSEFRRKASEEAISWKGGTITDKIPYIMYESSGFKVILNKPGKESLPEYNRCNYKGRKKGNNPNDMTPTLLFNGKVHDNKFGFDDIFEIIDSIRDIGALEVFGAILFRMAYMLDHKLNSNNQIRLDIPKDALLVLQNRCPVIIGIPIKIFIEMLEIISLNEDVKYYTLGYNDNFTNGTGKRNNLLTYVRLVALLLKKESFYKFVGSFSRPPVGISAISNSKAFEVFPDLS